MTAPQHEHEVLWDLIRGIRFAMLTHRHADGRLHAHPLTTMNRSLEADGCLYFFVSRSTEIGQRLQQDGNVNLCYAHPGKDQYASVTGTARVLEDLDRKRALFSPMAKPWFPGGPDDPDLELVEVQIEEAEYWNIQESKLTQVVKMVRAAVDGRRPQDLGEHRQLRYD